MPPSSDRRKKSGAKSTNEPLKLKDRDIAESNKTVAFFLGVPRRAQPWASQSLRPASNAGSIRRRRSRGVDTQNQIDISALNTGIGNGVVVPTSESPTHAKAQTQAPMVVLDPKPYASRSPTMAGPIHSVGFRSNCSRDPTPPPEQNQQGHHAPYATRQTFTSSNAPEATATSSPTSSPVPRLTRTCSQPYTSRHTTFTITENSTDTCLAQHRHLAFNRNGNVGDKLEVLTPIHHAAENGKNNHGLESNHPSQLISHHVRNISAGDYALPRFPSGAQNTFDRDDRGSNNSSNLSQHHDSSLNPFSLSTQSTYQPHNSTTPNPGAASNPGGPVLPRNVPSSKPNEPRSQNLTATITSPTASPHARIQLASPNEATPTEPSHANIDAVEITLRSPQILAEARNKDPQPNAISDAMPSNPADTIIQPQILTAAPTHDDAGKTNADNGRTSLDRKRMYVALESAAKRLCSRPEWQQESVICTPVPTEARAIAPATTMSTVAATPSVFAPTTTAPLSAQTLALSSIPTTSPPTASSETTSSFFSLDWDDIAWRERACEQNNRYNSSIIVAGRLSLLRNAIVGRDVFYLVLHQIFSLTFVNMDFASNLLGIPKHEMTLIIRVMSSIICSSSDVGQNFHLFAISFPFPWFKMSPGDLPKEVGKTIRAIPHFLRRISTLYPKMLSHSKARGYPLLPRELSRGLLLPSATMLRAIYCSNCRTLGITDGHHPNMPQILVTLRAQMTARFLLCLQIENNSQFTSAELKHAEIKAIGHMKLCVKTYAEFLRNNNIPQSTVVSKPPTLVPTVAGTSQTQALAQIQTQAWAQAQISPRAQTRTQTLDQTRRQRRTMYPNEQAHTPQQQYYLNQGRQLIQGRPLQQTERQQQQRQLQRTETQCPSLQSNPGLLPNQLGSTPLSLPASLQNQAAISAINTFAAGIPSNTPSRGNQQARCNIDAWSQPQLQPQQQARLEIPSLHSQAYQAQNHHTRAQQHHPTRPVPNLPAQALLSEFQLLQTVQNRPQRLYSQLLQHPNASPSIASTSNAPSSNMAVAASNSIAPPQTPDKLQRLLLPTSNARIHPNLYPVNEYLAIQAACHNAIAMPPIMQLGYEPTMTHTTHLQYASGFAHPPTLIEKICIIDNALFSVSSNDLRMLARHQPAPGFHQLKIRKYQAGSLTLRMRMCYFPSSHKGEIRLEDWLVAKHVWPTLITIKLNGNIQTNVGRKEVFHHDLPLDITNLVVGGMNELSVGYFQKKAGFELYYAIEFVEIETPHTLHDRILNHQTLPAAITIETIVSRLTATQDDDILASEEMVISLRDPFSTRILKHPVRGMKCSHLECFDLHTWLTTRPIIRKCSLVTGQPCTSENICGLCQRRPKSVLESPPSNPDRWSCPVYGCSEDASPNNLRLDMFLLSVCIEIPASDDVQAVIVDKLGNTKLKFVTMDDATNQTQSLRKGRPLPSTGLDVAKSQDTTHTGGREESQGETTAQEPVVIDLDLY
ncbi:hypothetical protein Cpir12675_000399 [Ceratocystis pirilliformis]|uniref:SP-RING-type domain-containing protein n=1 Tax=Ceratocystis pirilliformis TaxID=259994 RepID=A0ABR3ZN83_9PEZI